MKHPLDGAVARISRANIHIEELKARIEEFRKASQDEIVSLEQQINVRHYGFDSEITMERYHPIEVPNDLSIIAGDIIYNLRSALDYLIYELARENSGREKSGTQFPIQDYRVNPKRPEEGLCRKG